MTDVLWGNLLHLSYNMWEDHPVEARHGLHGYLPDLTFEYELAKDILARMSEVGMNLAVIDVGDGIEYESHPEISVNGAWTIDRMKKELARIREMGLEPIPKLNFAATHDAWLGPYARCVSTDAYYAVCKDLVAEVIAIFDRPRFFHLGMDEENAEHQRHHHYVVVRQFDLWWHDFYLLVDQVQEGGSRPWIWSDYLWQHPDLFYQKMPKEVVQSNWYYGNEFNEEIAEVKAYRELEEHGYDQIPTGSNHSHPENFGLTVDHCKQVVSPERLLGFLQTIWRPTIEPYRRRFMESVEQVGEAIGKNRED